MNIDNLRDELDSIEDEEIRNLTQECLEKAPPHFWYRPASSTGKHHAEEENEQGGLVLHTKRVCKVAYTLCGAWITPINADIVKSACLLHDICKYGISYSAYRYTLNNHPQLAADFLKKVAGDKYDIEEVNAISNAIASHMGRWSINPSIDLLMVPENLIVHLADVVATKMYEQV